MQEIPVTQKERKKKFAKSGATSLWGKWKGRNAAQKVEALVRATVATAMAGGMALGTVGYVRANDAQDHIKNNESAWLQDLQGAQQTAQLAAENAASAKEVANEAQADAAAAQTKADQAEAKAEEIQKKADAAEATAAQAKAKAEETQKQATAAQAAADQAKAEAVASQAKADQALADLETVKDDAASTQEQVDVAQAVADKAQADAVAAASAATSAQTTADAAKNDAMVATQNAANAQKAADAAQQDADEALALAQQALSKAESAQAAADAAQATANQAISDAAAAQATADQALNAAVLATKNAPKLIAVPTMDVVIAAPSGPYGPVISPELGTYVLDYGLTAPAGYTTSVNFIIYDQNGVQQANIFSGGTAAGLRNPNNRALITFQPGWTARFVLDITSNTSPGTAPVTNAYVLLTPVTGG